MKGGYFPFKILLFPHEVRRRALYSHLLPLGSHSHDIFMVQREWTCKYRCALPHFSLCFYSAWMNYRIFCPARSQNIRRRSALRGARTGGPRSSPSTCTAGDPTTQPSLPGRLIRVRPGPLGADRSHLRRPARPRPARWARGRGAGAR